MKLREIEFRGMDANGVMRHGRLSQDKPGSTNYYDEYSQRLCWNNSNIPVSNKTLGQFTGLLDKNGKKIFEGDIVKAYYPDESKSRTGEITWSDNFCGWALTDSAWNMRLSAFSAAMEIIGNIHENSELLAVTA